MATYEIPQLEELDTLALEYKREYGTASRELEWSDFVNNPFLNSPASVLRLLSTEKGSDLLLCEEEAAMDRLRYEIVDSKRLPPGEARVEAIAHDGDGECYVVIFSGPRATERAEEYAAWKNVMEKGKKPNLNP